MKHIANSQKQAQRISTFYLVAAIILFGFFAIFGQFSNHAYADIAVGFGMAGTLLALASFYRIDAWAFEFEQKFKGEQQFGPA